MIGSPCGERRSPSDSSRCRAEATIKLCAISCAGARSRVIEPNHPDSDNVDVGVVHCFPQDPWQSGKLGHFLKKPFFGQRAADILVCARAVQSNYALSCQGVRKNRSFALGPKVQSKVSTPKLTGGLVTPLPILRVSWLPGRLL